MNKKPIQMLLLVIEKIVKLREEKPYIIKKRISLNKQKF